jgi:hypothetical protein
MLDKTKQPFSGAVIFDKIEDMLTFMGWQPDMSPKAQAERAAWQDEASMSPAERREALEARRAKG